MSEGDDPVEPTDSNPNPNPNSGPSPSQDGDAENGRSPDLRSNSDGGTVRAEPPGESSETADGAVLAAGPRKLHPLTVPYQLGQQGIGLAFFLYFFGVPGLTAVLGGENRLLALGVATALGAAVVGYFVARYRRYEYELTPDTFDIRSGVFSRREREIPLRRIQNVDISQSVVQRGLGLAGVGLETAGGGDTEAQLQYVGVEEADRLQSEVSRLRRSGSEATGDPEAEPEPADIAFEITSRELGVLALVSTDFRVLSLLFFGGSVFGIPAFSRVEPPVVGGPENILGALFGPLAGILAILVIGFLSGLFNAARYYGFTLYRGDEELRYERGLFQRFSGTIPLSKVQTLTIRENVLARTLGYAALYIETAGHTVSSSDGDGSQSAIPLADRDRVRSFATSVEDANVDEFERPPKRARQRYAARYTIALVALTGTLYLGSLSFELLSYWWAALAGVVLVPVAAHLKWANRGYAVGEDHVVTRNGFWSRKTKVVPYHRVQTTVSSETVFQRRRRLGTVIVDTAGSRSFGGDDAKAVDVDAATMERLRESVSDRLYGALADRRRERTRERIRSLEGEFDASGDPSVD